MPKQSTSKSVTRSDKNVKVVAKKAAPVTKAIKKTTKAVAPKTKVAHAAPAKDTTPVKADSKPKSIKRTKTMADVVSDAKKTVHKSAGDKKLSRSVRPAKKEAAKVATKAHPAKKAAAKPKTTKTVKAAAKPTKPVAKATKPAAKPVKKAAAKKI